MAVRDQGVNVCECREYAEYHATGLAELVRRTEVTRDEVGVCGCR